MRSAAVTYFLPKSPSSRRAWIEIRLSTNTVKTKTVALLAEGVDRNLAYVGTPTATVMSPSSRRAWIEII